jgi:hypothetical protein
MVSSQQLGGQCGPGRGGQCSSGGVRCKNVSKTPENRDVNKLTHGGPSQLRPASPAASGSGGEHVSRQQRTFGGGYHERRDHHNASEGHRYRCCRERRRGGQWKLNITD